MATLLLTAIGTQIGGPIGGAIGSIAGQSIDGAVFGNGSREGPRLKELSASTSSYGQPIPHHFGRMRAAGSIIWSTPLQETKEKNGGGKGKPSTVTYNYSVSFAVALASKPIDGIGRIWADGNLLRGTAGDLKVGGAMRIYLGHSDQAVDPLIRADQGAACPAFRGLSYVVFEDLQLAEFGNRIPALTFEVLATFVPPSLHQLVERSPYNIDASAKLIGLAGYTNDGGTIGQSLSVIGSVYPLSLDASTASVSIRARPRTTENAVLLPEPATLAESSEFGEIDGRSSDREISTTKVTNSVRYYDLDRDYLPGIQRAQGKANLGYQRSLDFPGALGAVTAKTLANQLVQREHWDKQSMKWRLAELDPALKPGTIVKVPDEAGFWRIVAWEWRDRGVELEIARIANANLTISDADSGNPATAPDNVTQPSKIEAVVLPPIELETGNLAGIYAAVSSSSAQWNGAALYENVDGALVELGYANSERSVIGHLKTNLTASNSLTIEWPASFDVEIVGLDMSLDSASTDKIAQGANRALIGNEIIQFALAEPLGAGQWRLSGLLRGRGGTEIEAQREHAIGTRFVLLDDRLTTISRSAISNTANFQIAAIGFGDMDPVLSSFASTADADRPLCPVHPSATQNSSGDLTLCWVRRAKGSYIWRDEVDVPLPENAEQYSVGLGDMSAPQREWIVSETQITISSAEISDLKADFPGEAVWVRQIGTFSRSPALHLFEL